MSQCFSHSPIVTGDGEQGAVQGRAGTMHSGHPWPAVGAGGDGYTRRTPANCRTRASSGGVGQAAGSSAYITQSVAKILC